jgi:hypothetical protein
MFTLISARDANSHRGEDRWCLVVCSWVGTDQVSRHWLATGRAMDLSWGQVAYPARKT